MGYITKRKDLTHSSAPRKSVSGDQMLIFFQQDEPVYYSFRSPECPLIYGEFTIIRKKVWECRWLAKLRVQRVYLREHGVEDMGSRFLRGEAVRRGFGAVYQHPQHDREQRHQHGSDVQGERLCAPQQGHKRQQRQTVLLLRLRKNGQNCNKRNSPLTSLSQLL